jgi:hypothetical protein
MVLAGLGIFCGAFAPIVRREIVPLPTCGLQSMLRHRVERFEKDADFAALLQVDYEGIKAQRNVLNWKGRIFLWEPLHMSKEPPSAASEYCFIVCSMTILVLPTDNLQFRSLCFL